MTKNKIAKEDISPLIEDYLKVIYKLSKTGQATTSRIAEVLGVTPPSVTTMLKKLSRMNLIKYSPYKSITLTKTGKKMALEVIRHHRLLELYLSQALGMPLPKVHSEADRLEHFISEDFEDKISELLGRPIKDPHGDPIPTKDGKVLEPSLSRLSDTKEGDTVVIKRVPDEDRKMLEYLTDRGVLPDTLVVVQKIEPFEGPLTLKIGNDVKQISHKLGKHVHVLILPKNYKRIVPLNEMKAGEKGIVVDISSSEEILRRLLDLGVTIGTEIKLVRRAPLGSPLEFEVMGTTLSIRDEDARTIKVAII